ncbi:TetR/AcrR family transcriptional regulator [Streptomyces sp. NPDC054796]
MPKQVDHEARRRKIAEALWQIASTRGLEGTRLRDVAAAADISLGQLQHYFTSKDEMLTFALGHIEELAEQRIRQRIAALPGEPAPYDVLRESLAEMLPLDEKSRTGNLVQIAYFVRAVHDEETRKKAQEGIPALRGFFASLLREGQERGEVADGRDVDAEAMLLIGLVDGLTSYVLLDVLTPDAALALLDHHLSGLFSSPSAPATP